MVLTENNSDQSYTHHQFIVGEQEKAFTNLGSNSNQADQIRSDQADLEPTQTEFANLHLSFELRNQIVALNNYS